MKPLLVLLVFVTSSFCCMAATGMHVEKGTCPVEKKKVTKKIKAAANAPRAQPGRRTSILTTGREYFFMLDR